MSTTTIRLPDDLKARVAEAAEHAGTTPHNFILQAISEKIAQEERQSNFNDVAESRYANIVATGKTIPWGEMRQYLENYLAGNVGAKLPTARKLVNKG
ncbi:ribbon-helix-helix protein, CopG family [Glaciimonas soli]|uniref:Ribbon-helix-helix protein, CopG family n=1 Tax=Glaciimonas soli TaxID=2590999 RepID=A0A843YRJ6_9BURK|nr:ribbon-helix-helix protein, CopG family [Glaciimonas soli]MQQ99891.1 ribbon-helix-helix protein, CopG family [Glaciimonas soli]